MSSDKHSPNPKARRRRLTERLTTLRERLYVPEKELEIYTGDFFRVCIFGSARIQPQDEIYQMTERLAFLMAEQGIDVLTGGGPGLMEAANKGHRAGTEEAQARGKSFGISIDLGFLEEPNEHLDIKHHHRKFSSRLDDFMRLSNAIIVTPGGIGTLLELYFSWQLLQVGHMSDRPIILLKGDFWKGLIDWTKDIQIAQGLISPEDMDWIHTADTPEEALKLISKHHKAFLKKHERKDAK